MGAFYIVGFECGLTMNTLGILQPPQWAVGTSRLLTVVRLNAIYFLKIHKSLILCLNYSYLNVFYLVHFYTKQNCLKFSGYPYGLSPT